MTRRRLRDEDLALWRQVARTTEPLARPKSREPAPVQKARFEPQPQPPAPAAPLPFFRVGENARPSGATGTMPGLTDRLSAMPVRMDKKAYGKLKRGKLSPDARIDLHGMTVERAHSALNGFVMRAYSQEKRLVLVITGKGKRSDDHGPIPVRQGVLRHNVPHWLSLPPLSDLVMQVSAAHGRHGGGGAFYVYLRRQR